MHQQMCKAFLLALVALESTTLVVAQKPKEAQGKKQITNSIGMKMVLIPAGEFMMGNRLVAEEEAAAFNSYWIGGYVPPVWFQTEYPRHRVRITRPFYLGVYHVTVGQFRRFIEDTGFKTESEKAKTKGVTGWNAEKRLFEFSERYSWRNPGFPRTDDHPVINVSWYDAVAFCKWLSRKEGKTYCLPTEAQWEYACRAGTTTRYYSGDDPETLAQVGNVADATAKAMFPDWSVTIKASDGYAFTAPVGSFKPNAFGLYDMHGNAKQWCADLYGHEYYAVSPVNDPSGPSSGRSRVCRGGSWMNKPDAARSAHRGGGGPISRGYLCGFRVARTPE